MKSAKSLLRYLLIAVFFISLLAFGAFAQESFTLESSTPENFAMCACGEKTINLLVKNYEDVTAAYSVSRTGSLDAYVQLSETSFSLDRGQSKTITAVISLPCSFEGQQDLSINVMNDVTVQRTAKYSITTGKCENMNVVAKADSIEACAGSSAIFQIAVANKGDFDESFKVGTDKFQDKISYSEAEFALAPGETKLIQLKFDTAQKDSGAKDFNFMIVAEKNQIQGKLPLSVNVNECYDFSISLNKNKERLLACGKSTYGLTIDNNADYKNNLEFEVLGPEWVKLNSNSSFSINAKDKKTVEINANVPCDASGTYNTQINVKIPDTNIIKTENLKLIVYPEALGYKLEQSFVISFYEEYPTAFAIVGIAILALIIVGVIISLKIAAKKMKKAKELKKKKELEKLSKLDEEILQLKTGASKEAKKGEKAEKKGKFPLWLKIALWLIVLGTAGFFGFFYPDTSGFVFENKAWFGAGALALLVLYIFIRIIVKMGKSAKKEDEREIKRIDDEVDKMKKGIKAHEKDVLSSVEKKYFMTKGLVRYLIGIIVILIFVGAGFFFAGTLNTEIQKQVKDLFKVQEPQLSTSSMMWVDAEKLQMSGSTILINDQTSIPLIITSKNGETSYDIKSGISWIKIFNGKIIVEEGKEETVYVRITPNDQLWGRHFIVQINANVKSEDNSTSSETVSLDLKFGRGDFIGSYLSYVLGGLILLILFIITFALFKKNKYEKKIEKIVHIKMSEIIQPKRGDLAKEFKGIEIHGGKQGHDDRYDTFKLNSKHKK